VGVSFSFYWPSLGLVYAALDANPMGQLFRSCFLETRLSYESLEPLIDFLAYLDQTLCLTNQKVVKLSTPTKGNQGLNNTSLYMAINRRQKKLESCPSPQKTREDL